LNVHWTQGRHWLGLAWWIFTPSPNYQGQSCLPESRSFFLKGMQYGKSLQWF
jgi:hypothetical protein